ncbi:MAG: response regulator [Deltaproteobacteria bacterium]|nr:response regulator [Deltaproteobacteria bacterium]
MFGSEPPPEYNVLEDEIAERTGLLGLIRRAFGGETIRLPTTWYDPRQLEQVKVIDGNRVAIQATFTPLWDGEGNVGHVAAVFKDLTAERMQHELAEAERDLLRLIIQQSGDGIIVANADGVIEIFNPAAMLQHGISGLRAAPPDEWGARYGLETPAGQPLPLEDTPLYRALHGDKVVDGRWSVRRPDGTIRMLNGTSTPLARADGTRAGAVLIARDETERLAGEQERAALLERERLARAEAERANRVKDEFLAMLGHELRNPLAPIFTALELIELRGQVQSGRELQVIRRQVDHLSRLVDDLLDVSRITGGKVVLRQTAIRIQDVLDRAAEIASPLLDTRQQRLVVQLEPDLMVYADAHRLTQVISNLLTNAAKFSPHEGEIVARARRDAADVVIEVRDTGIGIAPDMLERVFDMFVQAHPSQTNERAGLGLGLTLVKSLVELHGGTVTVASGGLDRGSTFAVRIPAGVPDPLPVPAAEQQPRAASASKRILLVDDNVDAALMLGEALSFAEHDVVVAHDGPTALSKLAQFTPEVAILDLGMPVMDGYELASLLREQLGDSVLLVALSGYGQPGDRARTAAAGFHLHLVKPVTCNDVLAAIQHDRALPRA